jgi:SprT protein
MEEEPKVITVDEKRARLEYRHIREWIRFACECNEVPELSQVVVVEFNSRFTRRLGDGGYNPLTYRASVRLSIPLWPRASAEDKRETVIHEACHVIVGYKFGQVASHGVEWREAMKNCGVEPLRTHTVDRTGLVRRQKRFVLLDCPNSGVEHKCRCTAREYNLLRRGTEFWCKRCGLHLHRESAVQEDGAASLKV